MMQLQTVFVEYNKELQKKQNELTQPIFQKAMGIIRRMATQDGYDVVVDKQAVPYVAQRSRSDRPHHHAVQSGRRRRRQAGCEKPGARQAARGKTGRACSAARTRDEAAAAACHQAARSKSLSQIALPRAITVDELERELGGELDPAARGAVVERVATPAAASRATDLMVLTGPRWQKAALRSPAICVCTPELGQRLPEGRRFRHSHPMWVLARVLENLVFSRESPRPSALGGGSRRGAAPSSHPTSCSVRVAVILAGAESGSRHHDRAECRDLRRRDAGSARRGRARAR